MLPYWQRCQALIRQLPPNVSVKYAGELHPDEVEPTLRHVRPVPVSHPWRELWPCDPRGLVVRRPRIAERQDALARARRRKCGSRPSRSTISPASPAGSTISPRSDDAERLRMRVGAHALGNDTATAAAESGSQPADARYRGRRHGRTASRRRPARPAKVCAPRVRWSSPSSTIICPASGPAGRSAPSCTWPTNSAIDFDFHIVTADRDLGDKRPYEGIIRQYLDPGRQCPGFLSLVGHVRLARVVARPQGARAST